MKNVIEFIKKYKVHILTTLLIVVYFGSCGKSRTIKKLEKSLTQSELTLDSIQKISHVNIEESYNKGFKSGKITERNDIITYILRSTKYPLDIRSRNLIVDITNDIENNEHVK
jgi:hypothetical protein